MPDRLASPALRKPLVYLPVGTNGYVSTWGAIMGNCPPKAH